MKKETLIQIILSTIGGVVFAIGMCMCLLPQWDMFAYGAVVSIIGVIIILCIIPIYIKAHPGKISKSISIKTVLTWVFGVVGALVMGFGMSRIMVDEPSRYDMVIGLATGIAGLIICILNYPIYSYIRNDSSK